jgi:UDP-N-acetylglucosamine 2-epimerase (non-hydrolysing)
MLIRVLVALGTRPEAIKLAPLIRALRQRVERFWLRVLVTGEQRSDLLRTLQLFQIEQDEEVDIGSSSDDSAHRLAMALEGVAESLKRHPVDLVLVLGDQLTTLGATIAAYYGRIPVVHVEAGLRVEGRNSPRFEEGPSPPGVESR